MLSEIFCILCTLAAFLDLIPLRPLARTEKESAKTRSKLVHQLEDSIGQPFPKWGNAKSEKKYHMAMVII